LLIGFWTPEKKKIFEEKMTKVLNNKLSPYELVNSLLKEKA
jgi:hypothetical protein